MHIGVTNMHFYKRKGLLNSTFLLQKELGVRSIKKSRC